MRASLKRLFSCSAVLVASLVLAIVPAWAGQDGNGEKKTDVGRLVVLGDSLSAGFQNFSLYDSDNVAPPGGQTHGFAALIAQQANVSLNLPLISYPGIPPALVLNGNEITRAPGVGSREPQTIPVQTLNLSVPGFDVADVLLHEVNVTQLAQASFEDVLTVEILDPGLLIGHPLPACGVEPYLNGVFLFSAAGCAIQLHPSTILVSAGSGDALQSLTLGIPPTSAKDFSAAYQLLLFVLSQTHAKIVVSNIPDVADVPFLLSVHDFETRCGFAPSGAGQADFVVPNLATPNFDVCMNYVVRPAALIAQAETAVHDYNIIIAGAAAQFGAVVVDVNRLFGRIAKKGYNVAGHHLTTHYLGGIFSLDAVHPTNTGYAILANAFIEKMDCELHMGIPPVNIEEVAEHDPLVF